MRNCRIIVVFELLAVLMLLTPIAQPAIAGKDLSARLLQDKMGNYEALATVLDQLEDAGMEALDPGECRELLSSMISKMPNADRVPPRRLPDDPAEHSEFLSTWMNQLRSAAQDATFYPPFDPTGSYEGEWWSGDGARCPLSSDMILPVQGSSFQLWFPTAIFTVGFDCISPGSDPSDVQTLGFLDNSGNLAYLAIGCTTGFCIMFVTSGVGVDVDEDGVMDGYGGEWAVLYGIAFIPVFGFAGEFDLTAITATPSSSSLGKPLRISR
jgi:hypothetical protein